MSDISPFKSIFLSFALKTLLSLIWLNYIANTQKLRAVFLNSFFYTIFTKIRNFIMSVHKYV